MAEPTFVTLKIRFFGVMNFGSSAESVGSALDDECGMTGFFRHNRAKKNVFRVHSV